MAIVKRGSVAIVTGGSSGIGLEFTKLLVKEGIKVVIADLQLTDEGKKFVDEAKDVIFVETNVTKWSDLDNVFKKAIEIFGTIDLIVPNAGVFETPSSNFWYPPGSEESKDKPEDNGYQVLDINLTHPIRLTQMGISYFMKEQKSGHILLVGSIAAQQSQAAKPLYCASKAAISSFTHSLAPLANPQEGIPKVVVNTMAPGMVETPLWDTNTDDVKVYKNYPFDWIQPHEIAEGMLKMCLTDEFGGGEVVEATKGKLRRVQILKDEGPPSNKEIAEMGQEKQKKMQEEMVKPVWKQMKRMMGQ